MKKLYNTSKRNKKFINLIIQNYNIHVIDSINNEKAFNFLSIFVIFYD